MTCYVGTCGCGLSRSFRGPLARKRAIYWWLKHARDNKCLPIFGPRRRMEAAA